MIFGCCYNDSIHVTSQTICHFHRLKRLTQREFSKRTASPEGCLLNTKFVVLSGPSNIRTITLIIKLSSSNFADGKPLDTHRTMYYERGEGYTHYIRIVRLCYTRCFVGENPPNPAPQAISYRTFTPIQLTRDQAFSSPQYESMSETVGRATAWLRVTGKNTSKQYI